eukprot:2950190-Rhodomonas_salina.2
MLASRSRGASADVWNDKVEINRLGNKVQIGNANNALLRLTPLDCADLLGQVSELQVGCCQTRTPRPPGSRGSDGPARTRHHRCVQLLRGSDLQIVEYGAPGPQGMQGPAGVPGPRGDYGPVGTSQLEPKRASTVELERDRDPGRVPLAGTPGMEGRPGRDGMPGVDGNPGSAGHVSA